MSPGAALAFLLTGPATNVTTFGVLSQLHGRRIALAFGALITLLAVALGRTVNALPSLEPGQTQLAHGHASGSLLEEIGLAAFALLCTLSLLRQGPRQFVGELFNFLGEDEGDAGEGEGNSHSCCDDGDSAESCDSAESLELSGSEDPDSSVAVTASSSSSNCCDH